MKNIYSTTPGALSSPPCAVGVPEEAPGKRQQYKRARVLDQYRRAETANAEKKRTSVIIRLEYRNEQSQRHCKVRRTLTANIKAGKLD